MDPRATLAAARGPLARPHQDPVSRPPHQQLFLGAASRAHLPLGLAVGMAVPSGAPPQSPASCGHRSLVRAWKTPDSSVGKGIRLLCRRSQCRRFDSWVRKIRWRRDRLPIPVFLGFPGGSAGKESTCNMGHLGSIPGLGNSLGEGNGYPLQYSDQNMTEQLSHTMISHCIMTNI